MYVAVTLKSVSKSKLQRVQSSLARIIAGTKLIEHITSVIAQLHWLPIAMRLQFKVALVTFEVVTTQQPTYK